MDNFTVEVDDTDVIRAIERLGYNTQMAIQSFLEQWALKWQRDLRIKITENKSVISGDLRRSMSIQKKSRWEYVVGSNVVYAPFVEYGTRRMGAKPYMKPVYDTNKPIFKSELEAILREALR